MGFFFRRSARAGPFRLNFSRSGIGASVGVKGARLTVTPRGTTYVTVGSHGFYYRETLSHPNDIRRVRPTIPSPAPPQVGSTEDTIATADSSDLVDSSADRLIQQLNERANMSNPAWILYAMAVISLVGMAIIPTVPSLPSLPDVTKPLAPERRANTNDEYSALTARYGEPDSIVFAEAHPLAPIPVGTAQYGAAQVKVVFVPNGCVDAYSQVMKIRALGSKNVALTKGEMKNVSRCAPPANAGWTTVDYIDSVEDAAISAEAATLRLGAVSVRKTAPPTVETQSTQGDRQQLTSRKLAKNSSRTRPDMKSNDEARLAAERIRLDIKGAETRMLYTRAALLLAALGLFVGGVVVHRKNAEKRVSRLFYELDEAEQKKHDVVKQSLDLLSRCHRIWRIESESSTSDWKRNAGASSLVRRTTISVGKLKPPRVETNVQVPCINMGRAQLYFLPDAILYRDGVGFGAIAYRDFRLAQGFTRFIESDALPADAAVVDRTWRYVNKKGGPDRRFNNNRQLPVLRLGVLVLTSSKGLNIQLNTSNPQQSLAFADCWHAQFQPSERSSEERSYSEPPPRRPEPSHGRTTMVRKILGVSEDASEAEISAAYRRLAQMYHPDKVAGLAQEFQELADKRMKEINAAYDALKRKG
jgi:hypothetical protein